ncbi:putative nuclease HARBI1 [Rhinatrema bivittatum]|uniref:putative nuclease HARBI1 n=1 Tax=Rhinatrema bivittatum TaxID=194408 RepID=UPI00112E5D48|nr:putative nuclease HARBI1 [Rhinatrema bivittatum]
MDSLYVLALALIFIRLRRRNARMRNARNARQIGEANRGAQQQGEPIRPENPAARPEEAEHRAIGRPGHRQAIGRPGRFIRTRATLFGMCERDVVRTFRLNSRAIFFLYEDLRCDLEPQTNRHHAVPGLTKLLGALNFFGTGSFQSPVSVVAGMTQASVSRHLSQVLQAMMKRMRKYIVFPTDPAELQQICSGFMGIAGMPNVLGAIDCTHIAFTPRLDEESAFRNRKHFHSMNVQVVCDAHLRILNVVANYPGSCHDAYIFARSSLGTRFPEGKYGEGWLLGDGGYGCKPWLLTPLQSPRTAAENRYNEAHGSTRNVIERTFGVLKGRFRCLDRSRGALRYSAEKVVSIILACCMLHNICQRFGVDAEVDENLPPDPPVELAAEADNTAQGHEVRQRIIESYFS